MRESRGTGSSSLHASNTRSDLQKVPRMSAAVGLSVWAGFLQDGVRECVCMRVHTYMHARKHITVIYIHTNKQIGYCEIIHAADIICVVLEEGAHTLHR